MKAQAGCWEPPVLCPLMGHLGRDITCAGDARAWGAPLPSLQASRGGFRRRCHPSRGVTSVQQRAGPGWGRPYPLESSRQAGAGARWGHSGCLVGADAVAFVHVEGPVVRLWGKEESGVPAPITLPKLKKPLHPFLPSLQDS